MMLSFRFFWLRYIATPILRAILAIFRCRRHYAVSFGFSYGFSIFVALFIDIVDTVASPRFSSWPIFFAAVHSWPRVAEHHCCRLLRHASITGAGFRRFSPPFRHLPPPLSGKDMKTALCAAAQAQR